MTAPSPCRQLALALAAFALTGAMLAAVSPGGAVAAHRRAGGPVAGVTLFRVHPGAMLRAGLWPSDSRVRAALA